MAHKRYEKANLEHDVKHPPPPSKIICHTSERKSIIFEKLAEDAHFPRGINFYALTAFVAIIFPISVTLQLSRNKKQNHKTSSPGAKNNSAYVW